MTEPSALTTHETEIERGERFEFGRNWTRFLRLVDQTKIQQATDSVSSMLGVKDLKGKSFLDVGSGSGLFSLAARRLGARVVSFDYDPKSVACTSELKRRFSENDPDWDIRTGSVLDESFLSGLGQFDVVYSWGVLHHTGDMWTALANVDRNVASNGKLFIALYNQQPFASRYWTFVKRTFNRFPASRPIFLAVHAIYPVLPSIIIKALQNREYPRGMSAWYDLYDWLGGYPFEVATPESVFSFYTNRGYQLTALKTVGGRLGCNEFVFRRN